MALSGRIYSFGFSNVTLTIQQDLLALYCSTGTSVGIHSLQLGQITGVTVQNFRIRLRYLAPTVTPGSGGGTSGINPYVPTDPATSSTARINDTAMATAGTQWDVWDDVWNSINGFTWFPPVGSRPPIAAPGGAFCLTLDSLPGSLVANGTMTFEEIP